MADILEGLLESGSAVQPPVLAILAERGRAGEEEQKSCQASINPDGDVQMRRVLRAGAFQCQATLGRN